MPEIKLKTRYKAAGDVFNALLAVDFDPETASAFLNDINDADVSPVVHGYWIPSPDGINPIRCSECNMPAPFAAGENEFGDFEICRYPSSYCHECGARMDGERKEQT